MLWVVDKSVSQWVSQWVRDVCISHQSDWIYYKQPIKFLVVKVKGTWEELIRIQFIATKYFSFYKRGRSIHILGLLRHFLWVRLTILVMEDMSLQVWNSTWTSCMQMKRDTFMLFFYFFIYLFIHIHTLITILKQLLTLFTVLHYCF